VNREPVEFIGIEFSDAHRSGVFVIGRIACAFPELLPGGGSSDLELDAVAVAEFVERIAGQREQVAEEVTGARNLLARAVIGFALANPSAVRQLSDEFSRALEHPRLNGTMPSSFQEAKRSQPQMVARYTGSTGKFDVR